MSTLDVIGLKKSLRKRPTLRCCNDMLNMCADVMPMSYLGTDEIPSTPGDLYCLIVFLFLATDYSLFSVQKRNSKDYKSLDTVKTTITT